MQMTSSREDQELVAAAREIIRLRYRPDWHVVGAALRSKSGRIHTGVHLEAYVGRVAVCAEAIALGRAITDGDPEITTVVAVRHAALEPGGTPSLPAIVSPCGMCRELIADYAPDAIILLDAGDRLLRTPVLELLPRKYRRS